MRYFWVELLVGVGFVAIFYLEIIRNIHQMPEFVHADWRLKMFFFSRQNLPILVFFVQRAMLFSLLVAAAFCDLQNRTIPISMMIFGTIIGLIFATACPWPWPNAVAAAMPKADPGFPIDEWWLLGPLNQQKLGLYPWPVWGPPPSWMPAGSWRLGLVTGLAGAFVGTFMLRGVKFLFEKGLGREALGLGDADLMMMVGAFLGWQPVVVAFLVGGMVSLVLALPQYFTRGVNELPFGPGLAIGTVITWMCWHWIGPNLQVLMFYPTIMGVFVVGCGAVILIMSFLMRAMRPSKAA